MNINKYDSITVTMVIKQYTVMCVKIASQISTVSFGQMSDQTVGCLVHMDNGWSHLVHRLGLKEWAHAGQGMVNDLENKEARAWSGLPLQRLSSSRTACRGKPLDIRRVTTASENCGDAEDDDDGCEAAGLLACFVGLPPEEMEINGSNYH